MSNPAPRHPSQTPRVAVFGLGGTIAMSARDDDTVVPTLTVEQLLDGIPGLAATGIDVDVVNFRSVPSASLGFEDLAELSEAIRARLADGVTTGIVVTQGTDTLEECAYLLDLHHDSDHPVIVTGAMRNPTLAGADGPANLLAAIQVAADPQARDLGVLVVFADQLHAASAVRKTHTTSIAAFQSPETGALGELVEGAVRLHARPTRRITLPRTTATARPPRVGLITSVFGDPGDHLRGMDDFDGLVVAAAGAGHIHSALVEPLAEFAATRPVVLASRTGAGPVLTNTYGYAGSESDLLARGLIPAGYLHPFKARILLRELLALGGDPSMLHAAFATAGGYTADPLPNPVPFRA